MTLHETLKAAAAEAAETLALPLGWEGETFAPPAGPHLRGRVVYEDERSAACGAHAPTRIDGSLEITAATLAGAGDSDAVALARRAAALFPRGRGVDCDGAEGSGEAVFAAPQVLAIRPDGARVHVTARMPFCAILFPVTTTQSPTGD